MPKDLHLKSFIMGGYECADHINRSGNRINLQKETFHDKEVRADYTALKKLGISVVREGVCWSVVETAPYQFDFSHLKLFFKVAAELDIQIIWDLCHFGYPDGIYPSHPHFSERFEALCKYFTIFHDENCSTTPWIVPINEISFLSWHSGDMRGTVPFAVDSGWDIKYHLCKAAILGTKAVKLVNENAVILAVEPLIKVHPENIDPDLKADRAMDDFQYQAMDIILGRQCPELGGSENMVDILGFNYYYNNQWYQESGKIIWPENAEMLTPFSQLLKIAQERYNFPIILSETGHFGSLRALWCEEIMAECLLALENGVDLRGICIYPVIDRPDWDNLDSYSNCGLWDLDAQGNRKAHMPYIRELLKASKNFIRN